MAPEMSAFCRYRPEVLLVHWNQDHRIGKVGCLHNDRFVYTGELLEFGSRKGELTVYNCGWVSERGCTAE